MTSNLIKLAAQGLLRPGVDPASVKPVKASVPTFADDAKALHGKMKGLFGGNPKKNAPITLGGSPGAMYGQTLPKQVKSPPAVKPSMPKAAPAPTKAPVKKPVQKTTTTPQAKPVPKAKVVPLQPKRIGPVTGKGLGQRQTSGVPKPPVTGGMKPRMRSGPMGKRAFIKLAMSLPSGFSEGLERAKNLPNPMQDLQSKVMPGLDKLDNSGKKDLLADTLRNFFARNPGMVNEDLIRGSAPEAMKGADLTPNFLEKLVNSDAVRNPYIMGGAAAAVPALAYGAYRYGKSKGDEEKELNKAACVRLGTACPSL